MTAEEIMKRATDVKDVMDIFISGDKAIVRPRTTRIEVKYEPSQVKARYGYTQIGHKPVFGLQFLSSEDWK